MDIIKRDGTNEKYQEKKIFNALLAAFQSINVQTYTDAKTDVLTKKVEEVTFFVQKHLFNMSDQNLSIQVEDIQDLVEKELMVRGYYQVAKSYILYRENRSKLRVARANLLTHFQSSIDLNDLLKEIQRDFPETVYSLVQLQLKFQSFLTPQIRENEKLLLLIQAAAELTTQEAPKWEFIAARLLYYQFAKQLAEKEANLAITSLSDKFVYLVQEQLYGAYLLEHYSLKEIEHYSQFLRPERNQLLTYSGLELLLKRYLVRSHQGEPLESPQEMFLAIAMHLAIKEADRETWVKHFYDTLSTLKMTLATPTLANARKPFHQLSSCFIDTVPDSLDGIYRSIDNFAKVSKYGGGMGLYFGKVRASGSNIRGFEGVAGGVIRWIRLVNDTAVAVDQLGMRQGAAAVYLDAWHRDLPEFLALRTNNGDDRMKAHDIFPAVCYPDYFWRMAKEQIDSDWYLMCPHEILTIKGYALEDSFGEEWERKYLDCVNDNRINKRVIPIKELIRLIIKSAVETGTPFVFNRDHVNYANPNGHKGIIYCSNLCTEIAQNMSAISLEEQKVQVINGETVVITVTKPGNFVVCNLASLSLGHIDVTDSEGLSEITQIAVRALDNVIDLNFFPLPYAKLNNQAYRPIGLGVSGYHHMLAKNGISWESEEHLTFGNQVFETINYAAIKASCEIAAEKGSYRYFEGSDWQTGAYFEKRGYNNQAWLALKEQVRTKGLRNAYLLSVAPTSSTSIIAGTTAGLDPVMNRYFLEEKKNGLMPRVAPDLSTETYWYYKNAHLIDQTWSIKANGVRQRHIDQAQSMNLYITNEYTFRSVLNLYILAWEEKVKTIYYVRSKSLEVEDCESCSS